jgi:hypothetical protein
MTYPQHYQCDSTFDYEMRQQNPFYQGRGITTWNLNHEYTLPNNGQLLPYEYATLNFTCTVPKCYSASNTKPGCGDTNVHGEDTCNVVFNAWRTGNGSVEDTIKLEYILNGSTISPCYISGYAGHGATQAFELANTGCADKYDDMGANTFVIHNTSGYTIQVDHPKIYRTYKMCNLWACAEGFCPTCAGSTLICSGGSYRGTSGDFDDTREDIPCNCAACGGLSYTCKQDTSYQGHTLYANGTNTFSWTFDWNNYSGYNYQGKSICLFNFNQVAPVEDADSDDIALVARLNGDDNNHIINTYYLSRYTNNVSGLFPSHNLATSNYYNDTGSNVVTLTNTGPVDVKMLEAIDIYRIFQSYDICENPCESGCQILCETCNSCSCESCYSGCETPCVLGCEIFCYMCETCETACEFACQDCQTCDGCVTCNTSCQWCNTCQPCESCYGCYNSCQLCDTCEGGCLPGCYACQSGY